MSRHDADCVPEHSRENPARREMLLGLDVRQGEMGLRRADKSNISNDMLTP